MKRSSPPRQQVKVHSVPAAAANLFISSVSSLADRAGAGRAKNRVLPGHRDFFKLRQRRGISAENLRESALFYGEERAILRKFYPYSPTDEFVLQE